MMKQYREWQERPLTYGCLVLNASIFIIVGAGFLWAMNDLQMIGGPWSRLLPVAFVVLGVLFTFFQVVPLVHRSESRTSDSSSEPKIPTLSWGTTTTSLGMSVFLHRVTPENRAGRHFTDIDNPHTNKNPKAIVLVTPNWNYDGSGKIYNDHAIGVWYRTETNKWSIFNQDKEEMVIGTAFNVMVADAPSNSFDASMDSDDM